MGSVVSSENEGPPNKSCADRGGDHASGDCILCRCGHERSVHGISGRPCAIISCGCTLFRAVPKGSASSSPDESPTVHDRCAQCTHERRHHGGGVCIVCSGFTAANHHAFVPADAETAGEPEAPECSHESWEVTGEFHTPKGWVKSRKCADCREGLDNITEAEPHWDLQPAEPEMPGCDGCGHGPHRDDPCGAPDCACAHPVPMPRRPPIAVAYELEDGTAFEIALAGDATVRSTDGVLIVMHSQSPVRGLVQYKPMEAQ
jgi:hypothetical protein